jgi:hypothetical protein
MYQKINIVKTKNNSWWEHHTSYGYREMRKHSMHQAVSNSSPSRILKKRQATVGPTTLWRPISSGIPVPLPKNHHLRPAAAVRGFHRRVHLQQLPLVREAVSSSSLQGAVGLSRATAAPRQRSESLRPLPALRAGAHQRPQGHGAASSSSPTCRAPRCP